jgi:hypothetical protein
MSLLTDLLGLVNATFRDKNTQAWQQKGPTRAWEARAVWNKALELLGAGPNLRPDLRKAVRWASVDVPGYDSEGPVLTQLDPATCCLSTTVDVDFDLDATGVVYKFVFDPAGTWDVWRDATFTGPKVKARLVRLDSAEAQTAGIPAWNEEEPEGYFGPGDADHPVSQVTQGDKIWACRQTHSLAAFPDGLPEPGTPAGAPYWKELSPTPVVHQQNTDLGTTSPEFVVGIGSESQGTTEYRLLKFVCDPQRPNAVFAARWVPQPDDSDQVQLVQCLNYVPPIGNPANVWAPIGGGLSALYVEDDTVLQLEAGGQTLGLDLGLYFEPRAPAGAFLVVEGHGQPASEGRRGSWSRRFPSIKAAHDAAQNGDAIIVLPGGGSLTSAGRPAYSEKTVLTKSVQIVGLGGPVVSGPSSSNNLEVGAYAGSPIRVRISGLEFFTPVPVLKPAFGAHDVEFTDCIWSGNSYLQLFGLGVNNGGIDRVVVRRGRFNSTLPAAAEGIVVLTQREDYDQAMHLTLEDCVVVSTGALLIGGTAHPSSRVVLAGITRLTPSGTAYQIKRLPSGALVPEADWLIEELITGGGGPALPTRDVFDVPGARRAAVVAAAAAVVPEDDAAFHGQEFYDEVTTPGTVYHYRCGPSVQADASTAWKWFRTLIQ